MLGIDNSPAMLADADAAQLGPAVTFELGDIERWTSDPAHDLVVANAALQWVPDHADVLARWTAGAGARAGSSPCRCRRTPTIRATGWPRRSPTSERFASDFPGRRPPPTPWRRTCCARRSTRELLYDLGFDASTSACRSTGTCCRRTASVVDWVSGTSLTRFQQASAARALRRVRRRVPRSPARRARRPCAVLLPVQADPDVGPRHRP